MGWIFDAAQVILMLVLVLMLVASVVFQLLVRWARDRATEETPKGGAPRGKGTP